MGLQVRVCHALGERLMDLPARTVENPVVVGRSSSADVQVPSVSVGQRHCALFVHEGVWVVQDLGGTSGTFVNGERVSEPTTLSIGDVVTVGAEAAAPRLEIDPAGTAEGRTGPAIAVGHPAPGTVAAHAPAAPGAAYAYASAPVAPVSPAVPYGGHPQAGGYVPVVPMAGGYVAPAGYGAPAPVTPMPAASYHAAAAAPHDPAAGWGEADASAHADHVQWENPAEGEAAAQYPRSRRRQRKQGGAGAVVIVLILIGLIGGGAWFILKKTGVIPSEVAVQNKPATPPPARPAATPGDYDNDPSVRSKMFGSPGGKSAPRVAAVPPPATTRPAAAPPAPATAPAVEVAVAPRTPTPPAPPKDPVTTNPPAPDPAPATDNGNGDPVGAAEGSWEQMVELDLVAPDPAVAILKFEDYKRNHPGQQDQKIDAFIEKKLDQIWWDRINGLFKTVDQIQAGMAKVKREIIEETNQEFKKKQLESYHQMEKDLKRTTAVLREELGYTEEKPPDLSSKARLEEARGRRDKAKFEAWKKRTHGFIKRNNGKLEWGK